MRFNDLPFDGSAALAAIVLLATGVVFLFGCPEEENDEVEVEECSAFGECPDDKFCDLRIEVCVEELPCEDAIDCPDGHICDDEDEICVEDEIVGEDYRISMFAEPRTSNGDDPEFRMVGSRDGSNEDIDTGSLDCDAALSCALTEDESHLLAVEQRDDATDDDDGNYAALVAPFDADALAVDGSVQAVAEYVDDARLRGDGFAYNRIEGGYYVAYYQSYDGDEVEIATLHDEETSQLSHVWDIDPTSGRVMQFIPTDLQSLDIRAGSMDEPLSSDHQVARFDGTNVGDGQGSFYLGMIPMNASEDGRYLAFYTSSSANNYENCTTTDDCSGTSHQCGQDDRCYALEPTVHVIDMEHAGMLGESCLGHDECGPVHRCDSGADDFDGGRCAPQRIVVGLTDTPPQGDPSREGCEAMRDDGSFGFTDVVPPMNFGPDGQVYFVGRRDCVRTQGDPDSDIESDVPRTAIIGADIQTGEFEEVYNNVAVDEYEDLESGEYDYNALGCGDPNEGVENRDECRGVIDGVRLSPDKNDLVYRASNPFAPPSLADAAFDIWRITRDGRDATWLGGLDASHDVVEDRVHTDGGE